MNETANRRCVSYCLNDLIIKIDRMRSQKTDSWDADPPDHAQQFRERWITVEPGPLRAGPALQAVRIYVLTQQRYFDYSCIFQRPSLFDYVLSRPRYFGPSRRRHNAVSAAVVTSAHDRQVRSDCACGRRRRVKLQLALELERLKPALLDCRDYLGNRSRSQHYIHSEFLAEPLALRQLGQTSYQSDRQSAPPLLFLPQLAKQRLRFLDRLAPDRAGIDNHKIGLVIVLDK